MMAHANDQMVVKDFNILISVSGSTLHVDIEFENAEQAEAMAFGLHENWEDTGTFWLSLRPNTD